MPMSDCYVSFKVLVRSPRASFILSLLLLPCLLLAFSGSLIDLIFDFYSPALCALLSIDLHVDLGARRRSRMGARRRRRSRAGAGDWGAPLLGVFCVLFLELAAGLASNRKSNFRILSE